MDENKSKMSVEESERYGREINAVNAANENMELYAEEPIIPEDQLPPPLSEEEIKKRVGETNYENLKDAKVMNSVNS